MSHRAGHVDQHDSLEYAEACRERPFSGRQGDEQIVTRTVVIYTTDWTEVPGHEGSPWLDCWHPDTPQGRTGKPIFPGANIRMEGPDYQRPHPFRERDMTAGEDGVRRYTCPVCGLMWRFHDGGPDKPAENMPADIPPDEPLLTLF